MATLHKAQGPWLFRRLQFTIATLVVSTSSFVTLYTPGIWDTDSWWSYRQISGSIADDWQPALLAWWWRLVTVSLQTPSALFVGCTSVFFVTWLAATARLATPWRLALAALPSVWVPVGCLVALLGKDIGFATFLLAALAVWHRSRPLAALCALVACAFRHNACFALLPLAGWACGELSLTGARRHLGALASCIVLVVSAALLNGALAQRSARMWQQIPVHDIAAIEERNGHHVEGFVAQSADRLLVRIPLDQRPASAALLSDWAAAVMRAPGAYVAHRWQMFWALVTHPGAAGSLEIEPNELDLEQPQTTRRRFLQASVSALPTWVWSPLVWLVAATAITLARWRHADALTKALLESMWLYEGAYFFVAPMPLYRYSCWPLLAAWWIVGRVSGANVTEQRPRS